MNTHENILQRMEEFLRQNAGGTPLLLPPPTLVELGARFLEFVPHTSLTISLPFQGRFTNPLGLYQGGMLGAALDEVFGPLSYMSAGAPCVTLEMSVTYLRPFRASDFELRIRGEILKQTSQFIFMRAEAITLGGEKVAVAQSHANIWRPRA